MYTLQQLMAANFVLVLGMCLGSIALAADAPSDGSMVYELRTYTTHAGKLDDLHTRFRDHTLALFKKHGMTNIIYWTPVDRPNTLVYLLAHKSRQARDASFTAFRDDPVWKKAYAASRVDGPLVEKVESVMLTPTDYSPAGTIAEQVKGKPGLTYELRTYMTHPGKLGDLHARFRDHTMKLFEKHGIANVLYTTPLDGQSAGNTLIYFIAHESPAAAKQSWKAFASDPAWKRVAKQSQRDGQILVKGGVQRLYLTPTDFSPIR